MGDLRKDRCISNNPLPKFHFKVQGMGSFTPLKSYFLFLIAL